MPASTSSVASRLKLLSGYRSLTHLLGLLILVQAVLAGNSNVLPYDGELDIFIHGMVGNVSFLVATIALVLALVARAPKGAIIVSGVIVVLLIAQIGLGYSAESARGAGAWHIPLGVLLFGLSVFQISKATAVVKDTSALERANG